MFSFNYNIVYFTLFYVFRVAYNLVELPAIEDNYIAVTETVIRNTVNDLFSTFKVRGSGNRPKLKKYSVIHNFFVSITLKDCDNLKKIVQLSRVNNIDNNTLHFIAQINEVFDESDNKSNEATDDIYVNMHIDKFINKLRDLKQLYQFNEYFSKNDINEKILEHLSKDGTTLADVTNETNRINESTDTIDNDDDQVWTPVLQSGRRIYNGHRTHITHYPFIASVLFFDKFHCAGSIIKTDLVITAASCLQLAWNNRFFRENPAFLSIQIGSDFYEAGGENIPVQEIYFHPEYDPKTLNNNIALMRISTHIRFSKVNKKVKRIDFDQHATPLPVDTGGIIIVGWGAKDNTGDIYSPWENRLSYAELDYYPMEECQEIYTKEYVTRKHFCAGFFTKPTGACQHDVGGPGVYRGYLIGVISFGPPICGTVDAPTVFTKVGFYKDWINKIIDTPAPYIKPQTTLRVSLNTFRPVYTKKTTKAYKIAPIIFEPKNVLRRESLRILEDDKLFKDFLSTMFKQKEINNVRGPNEEPVQKEILRHKYSTKAATTYKYIEVFEPNKTTTNLLGNGFMFDVVANKLLDFMGLKETKPTTTDMSLTKVIENRINVEVKSNTKTETEINEYSKNNDAYSDEENSDDLMTDVISPDFSKEKSTQQTRPTNHHKLNKAKTKSDTASTFPLFVGIEYNDDDSRELQPKFKTSDKDFKLKDDDSSILEIDDDKNEKTLKQRASKVYKFKKVKGRSSASLTRKPGNSEYENLISDKLKEYENIDNGSELDSLVKDILDYVEEKPKKSTKSKKDIIVKKTRSKYPAATTPLLKESLHWAKYDTKKVDKMKTTEIMTKYKHKNAIANEKIDNNFIFENEMTINVDVDKDKVSKYMRATKRSKFTKTRTTATADIILPPVKSEYEDEDNKKYELKMRGTDTSTEIYVDDDDFVFKADETNLVGAINNKTASQYKVKKGKKVKSRNMIIEANTSTFEKKKSHENINPQLQLDSLVKDILDFVEGEPIEHIISEKMTSGKKGRKRVSTATTRLFKKVKHGNNNEKDFLPESKKKKPKDKYDHVNEEIIGGSASELDISKLEAKTKSSTVQKSFSDEVEFDDDNSKIIQSKKEFTKTPRKLKDKYAGDKNINDYSNLEINSKNLDLSEGKTLRTTEEAKSHRGKPRSSKHLHKHKPKHATDSTVSIDKTQYANEDGESDFKNNEVSKHFMNKNSNIDDDTINDMNTEEDVSNDSKLEKDITELLDELDLRKIFESTENTVQVKGSKKKKKIKGKAEKVKVRKGQTSSQSSGGEGSGEAS